MATRKSKLIPLIDEPSLEKIDGSKCPTSSHVFRHYWFLRFEKKKSVPTAKKEAVQAAKSPWVEAGFGEFAQNLLG